LNRPPSKRDLLKAQQEALEDELEDEPVAPVKGKKAKKGKDKSVGDDIDWEEDPENPMSALMNNLKKLKDKSEDESGKKKESKHVKGGAEELHKRDEGFSPKLESSGISDSERKALEDQVAKLKRQHEEAELKSQKRIVELLEKSSSQQKAVDDAEREARSHKLNISEMSMKVQDLESKHKAAELSATDERQRAEGLRSELESTRFEIDRHKSRADGAERERDLHMEAAKRHEDNLKRKHEEVSEHLGRIERQTREADDLRSQLRRREDEVAELRRKVLELGGSAAALSPSPNAEAVPAGPGATAEAARAPDAADAGAGASSQGGAAATSGDPAAGDPPAAQASDAAAKPAS